MVSSNAYVYYTGIFSTFQVNLYNALCRPSVSCLSQVWYVVKRFFFNREETVSKNSEKEYCFSILSV